MHPEHAVRPRENPGRNRAGGVALVAALSVLVLLSLKGALMVSLAGLQQAGSSAQSTNSAAKVIRTDRRQGQLRDLRFTQSTSFAGSRPPRSREPPRKEITFA